MESFLLIIEFFGILILLLGLGILIGHLLKLDKYIEDRQNDRDMDLLNTHSNNVDANPG